MRFRPTPLEPTQRPTLEEAKVLGDVKIEQRVEVRVGGVAFVFWRDEEDWTGGTAVTAQRGQPLDERWLQAARGVAIEALTREIRGQGLDVIAPTETVRCRECGKLLLSTEIVGAGEIVGIDCGPLHAISFRDGRALTFRPDGSTAWTIVGGDD